MLVPGSDNLSDFETFRKNKQKQKKQINWKNLLKKNFTLLKSEFCKICILPGKTSVVSNVL